MRRLQVAAVRCADMQLNATPCNTRNGSPQGVTHPSWHLIIYANRHTHEIGTPFRMANRVGVQGRECSHTVYAFAAAGSEARYVFQPSPGSVASYEANRRSGRLSFSYSAGLARVDVPFR
jgi:hypothetical protein